MALESMYLTIIHIFKVLKFSQHQQKNYLLKICASNIYVNERTYVQQIIERAYNKRKKIKNFN